MTRKLQVGLAGGLLLAFAACADDPGPTSPPQEDANVLTSESPGRPIQWSAHEIADCPLGEGQLQSIYPLDEQGTLVLVGRYPCSGQGEDYQVFDLSSGEPVKVAGVNIEEGPGFVNMAAHSPRGSSVGFGGEFRRLAVYDGEFQLTELPCPADHCPQMIWDVWAGSASDVWIVTSTLLPDQGNGARIFRFDGAEFTIEHEGGYLRGIWGFGGPDPKVMFAVGDRILQRNRDGTWYEVLDPDALPRACHRGLGEVIGQNAQDVWAAGFSCVMHYDGRGWTQLPRPDRLCRIGGIWPLDAKHILLAGQCGVDLAEGRIALWGSEDGGLTWAQFSDPLFRALPEGGDAAFFALAATWGGSRVYAPGILGTLLVGDPGNSGRQSFAGFSLADGPALDRMDNLESASSPAVHLK
jgi:hypothetical protein